MANKATNEAVETANETVNETVKTKATKEKKVAKKSLIIPINDKDPDTYVPVVINGKITQIKKGEEV